MKHIIVLIGLILLTVGNVNAEFINGNFTECNGDGWSHVGGEVYGTTYGNSGCGCVLQVAPIAGINSISQSVDVTNYGAVNMWSHRGTNTATKYELIVGAETFDLCENCQQDYNISSTGVQTITIRRVDGVGGSDWLYVDSISLSDYISPPAPHTFNFKDECGNMFKDGTLNV